MGRSAKPTFSLLAALAIACSWIVAVHIPELHAAPVQRPHIEAELIAEKNALIPGQTATIALRLKADKHWHTYWKNPGDSGLPTRITWTLPPGFEPGPIQWPAPQRLDVGPLTNFGYEGEVFLLTDIRVPATLAAGTTVPISARADWLVCEEICIPGDASFNLALPVSQQAHPDPAWADAIKRSRDGLPRPIEGWNLNAYLRGGDIVLQLRSTEARPPRLHNLVFFPDEDGWISNASPQRMIRTSQGYELRVASAPALDAGRGTLAGLLVAKPGLAKGVGAATVVVALESATDLVAEELALEAQSEPEKGIGMAVALALALLGGVILNLMPCVFPVVSIKVLGFVEQARGSPASLRAHGIAFTLGVLLSFWAVAGILLGLRAQGEALGWGYQLQSPPVVAALAVLFFVLALNLSGLFQIGTALQSLGGGLRLRNPYADSALSGILATIVATPCTAPFMGAALGFAMVQSPPAAMLVFTSLAFGMAAPYLLLSFFPALLRHLPRPGKWMETLKQVLAFPLYLTVVWLAWVLGRQVGVDAVAGLAAGLTLIGAALWMLGRWRRPHIRAGARRGITAVALLLAVAGIALAWPGHVAPEAATVAEKSDGPWKPWSEAAVAEARASGKAVFVDFTAAWCVTCQVNKRLVLDSDSVEARLQRDDIVLLRADWTNQDADITAALRSLGRIGVPVYAVYRAGSDAAPTLLPELLTREKVLQAIEDAVAAPVQ